MTKEEFHIWLAARTTKDGDCLMWTGALNSAGFPVASVAGKSAISVRRFVAKMNDRQVVRGIVVVTDCNRTTCLNIEHLRCVTLSKKTELSWSRGLINRSVASANGSKHGQKMSKLNWELVRQMRARRADGETVTKLAADYGVGISTVSAICLHQRWVDVGPFSQLLGLK